MSDTVTEMPTDNINALNCNEIISDRNSDSGVQLHDAENNIAEKVDLIDINNGDLNLSNGSGVMISDFSNDYNEECEVMNTQLKDEEFHDAVQFFKDPSSFNFLERAGSSDAATEPSSIRSSLYMSFDPLHAKFPSQSITCNGLDEISEVDVPEVPDSQTHSEPNIVNKHLDNVSPRQSLSNNILISFDSPVLNGNIVSMELNNFPCEPPKLYTEEEFQQTLKIQELTVQDTFLKRQHDLEQKLHETEAKLENTVGQMKQQNTLCSSFSEVLKELCDTAFFVSEEKKKMQDSYEKEINKLKEDLKTSNDDLQSVESTFSDFHKRYEQCKGMLKVYTQNEDNLKQQLENLNIKLQEKEEMYKALQSRTEEMVDKANTEVANAKKSGEAQIAVLKAQLKKAELKISSLESDVKHIKGENCQLSTVIDELMAKVSEG